MFAIPLQPCFAALAFAWLSGTPVSAAAPAGGRVRFTDSIVEVPIAAPDSNPRRVREILTEAELAESVDFIVSLKMRDLDRLRAFAQSKRTVSMPEMETVYLPLKSDYDRVAAWLTAQGFAITLVDSNHTNIVARGSVAKIADALEVSFARVATDQGEFTSAGRAQDRPGAGHRGAGIHLWAGAGLPAEGRICAGAQAAQAARARGPRDLCDRKSTR